jgi:KTSC domain
MSLPSLTPVKSSNIASIAHRDGKLFVKFIGGNSVYEYEGVPAKVHEDLLASDSVGRHFAHHVKGKYSHRIHAL